MLNRRGRVFQNTTRMLCQSFLVLYVYYYIEYDRCLSWMSRWLLNKRFYIGKQQLNIRDGVV